MLGRLDRCISDSIGRPDSIIRPRPSVHYFSQAKTKPCFFDAGDNESALSLLATAAESAKQLPVSIRAQTLGLAYNALGLGEIEAGRFAEAESNLEEAIVWIDATGDSIFVLKGHAMQNLAPAWRTRSSNHTRIG
jgi:hypothetical protein